MSIPNDEGGHMRRRELIALLGGVFLALPEAARGQQPGRMRRVFRVAALIQGSATTMGGPFDALRTGLRELGYIEGENLRLTVRWNEGHLDRLPDLAAELLRDNPDVFVGAPVLSAAAAHKHTRTVPIVIATGAGVLQSGLAKSYARPGGNVTGVVNLGEELTSKQLQLLKEISPGISNVAVLSSGAAIVRDEIWRDAARAALALKLNLVDVRIRTLGELPRLAAICGQGNCNGLLVMLDPILQNWRAEIVGAVSQLKIPAIYPQPGFTRAGGLMSYSANVEERYRRAATYVDKILKGANPGELPIEQPTKFQLIVNSKTAKSLGIEIPNLIYALADEVIE